MHARYFYFEFFIFHDSLYIIIVLLIWLIFLEIYQRGIINLDQLDVTMNENALE